MKNLLLFSAVFIMFALLSCDKNENNPLVKEEEVVVIANRSSGSISFIDAVADQIVGTLTISGSEPMYIVYVAVKDKIYVGDRANSQVHVINPDTRQVENSVAVGDGVFHMWADGQGKQLWVSNDADNTVSVIDLSNNEVIKTIEIGVKPHDVFLSKLGARAYVSVRAGDETVLDSIYSYSTTTFEKLASKAVGEDPHLFHIAEKNQLYVPNQSGNMFVLNESDLNEISNVSLPGSHGIYPSSDNKYLFITNLPGSQIYAFQTSSNMVSDPILDTELPIPHNITVNAEGNKVYVTHSGGSANQVVVYSHENGVLVLLKILTVESNPFGLGYYKRKSK